MSRQLSNNPKLVSTNRKGMPPSKNGVSPGVILLGIVLPLLAFVCGFGTLTIQADISQPVAKLGAPSQSFVVNSGDSFKIVTANLEKQKLIRNAIVFQYYVKYKQINPSIEPGTYQISPSMTFTQILGVLAQGTSASVAEITIPDGQRVSQYPADIASATDKAGNAVTLPNFSTSDFLNYAVKGTSFDGENNYWYVQSWDTSKGAYAALEGYLYPDHYEIYQNATTLDVIKLMLTTFGEKLCPGPDAGHLDQYIFDQAQCKAHEAKIDYSSNMFAGSDGKVLPVSGSGPAIGIFEALTARELTLPQAVILASIVEREARSPVNYASVASVYYNRYKNSNSETAGYLNADPAYQYYLGSKAGASEPWAPLNQLPDHQETSNPYNTYAHKGLPPSAISNPTTIPLYVALYPPVTNYYWFFFGKDCQNHYDNSYAQFKQDMQKYLVAGPNDCKG